MKIAFDAKRAFMNYSGLGNYSRTLIHSASTYYPDNEYFLYTPSKENNFKDFPPKDAKIVFPESLFNKKFSSYWRTYKIADSLKDQKIDLYHGLSHELPQNIEKSGSKSIVTIHDLIYYRYPELYNIIDRKIYHKKLKHAVRVADKIIAISNQTKRDIISFLNVEESKIEVLYQSSNPLYNIQLENEQLFLIKKKYNLPSEFILSVGTIEKRKNLLKLLQAVQHSKSKIPVVVVGKEKDYANEVHNFILENNIANILFLKNVSNAELSGIYQLATLFIYPSSFEGFGLPVLESLQSGTPVIAAKGSCLEEAGGKHSVYIDPFNIEEFAHAINLVLDNSKLRNEMKIKGLEFSKKFETKTIIKSLFKIYESII